LRAPGDWVTWGTHKPLAPNGEARGMAVKEADRTRRQSDEVARVDSALVRAVRESRPEFRYASKAQLIRIALNNLLGNPADTGAHSS
jgi:hypothetical protein